LTRLATKVYLVGMTTSLRQKLDELASTFENGVLHAIRSASLDDLLAESSTRRSAPAHSAPRVSRPAPSVARASGGGRRGGRLARRSPADIATVVHRIADLLKGSTHGLRAEQIRQKLGLRANEMPRPLKEGLSSGRLGKSGQKRATTYFLKGGGGSRPAAHAAGAAKAGPPAKARKAGRPAKANKK
jgi:hypothetical protein